MSVYVLAMRFAFAAAAILAFTAPALAQECRFYSPGGLSVEIHENSTLTIYGSDGSETVCDIQHTEFNTVKSYHCDGFSGDLYMMPSTINGPHPDLIFMPPNPLYFHCATPA